MDSVEAEIEQAKAAIWQTVIMLSASGISPVQLATALIINLNNVAKADPKVAAIMNKAYSDFYKG